MVTPPACSMVLISTLAGSLVRALLTAVTSASPPVASAVMPPLIPLTSSVWPAVSRPRHAKSSASDGVASARAPATQTKSILFICPLLSALADDHVAGQRLDGHGGAPLAGREGELLLVG